MPVKGGPNIQTAQALVFLDSADKLSYPGTGTTWTNSVSPGTFNGTLNNGISFDPDDALGALVFTGSNPFVDVGNIGAISASFTFQVAVKPFPTSSGGVYTILSYTSGSGTGSLTFKLDYSSSSQIATLSTFVSSGSVNQVYNLTASVSTGSWSILHGVFGSGVFGFYKNGTPVTSVGTTGSFTGYSTNNRLLVGGISQFTGSYLSGSVANVAVYNSGLGRRGVATNYNGLATRFGLPNIVVPITDDEDVQTFVEITGISNPIQIQALNTLVTGLKSYSIWSKMKAIYPFIGGTATTHKYNLKNPNTFTGTFVGGWTHSSTGALPNGTNAYMDTTLVPSTNLSLNSTHLSYYSRTDVAAGNQQVEIGSWLSSYSSGIELALKRYVTNGTYVYINSGVDTISPVTQNSSAFFVGSRTASNVVKLWRNNTLLVSGNQISSTLSTFTMYVGGANNFGSPGNYSAKECAFASIGDGLTDAEAANLYTIVQNYQTTLGRQV
jgi:hypothetical protein